MLRQVGASERCMAMWQSWGTVAIAPEAMYRPLDTLWHHVRDWDRKYRNFGVGNAKMQCEIGVRIGVSEA